MKGKVYICHHIDTEGPLYESLGELFKRVKFVTGIELEATEENVRRLQSREIEVTDELWEELKLIIDPHTINFLGDWEKIDTMLNEIMSEEYRKAMVDSEGNGWCYNWHVMDHVGFTGENPRRRDLGYLKIFDYYQKRISEPNSQRDELHWHFHPISFSKDAHIPATSYENSMDELHQILSRRLIERSWFPIVNRAGFHTVRFDSNHFLEQWIPFDPSNQAIKEEFQPKLQRDLTNGRFGDWRGAPFDWSMYHPNHRDWRKTGDMNRYVARVLNMNSRHRNITFDEIAVAFERAEKGERVYLGITNHDWRDMKKEIDDFRVLLSSVIRQFPDVDFEFSETLSAFQQILFDETERTQNSVKWNIALEGNQLLISITQGETFGPQPYLAIKTKDGKYFHDNFDYLNHSSQDFSYTFDEYTIPLNNVESFAVATNDKYGNQVIEHLKP
ncbi:Uncharacterised protein [Sphingobacterium spiritivorum]|uniref:Uncharacterized protein n=1 Tax=Sphingobacterium spiritivorum TaxID=258 RepID=A0A380C6I9_SPHSI|nr:hypothetical protein [Sphingobacterium spiritivorum]SUJ13123.1 Uncharacterised protein [Sphingobacterium spiritivorum]